MTGKQGYLMALDAGGGGGHCLLVDCASGEITRGFRAWTHPAAPGTDGLGHDLDLQAIWERLGEAAREALARAGAQPGEVLGIAVTSMRCALVVIDDDGRALLTAANRDGRAVCEGFELAAELGDELYARTGHWPCPVLAAPRLRWLAAHNPQAGRQAAAAMSLSDWVTYRLCGVIATDLSQAGETLLFDLEKRQWAWDLIERLGIPRQLFPPVRASGTRVGALSADAAANLGLHTGTPIAMGGGDTQCGLVGAGAVAAGQVAAIVGTSAPVQLVLDRPRIDPKQRLWTGCHVVPELWVIESNGGLMGEALDWFARVLYPDCDRAVARLLAEAGTSQPGASGVLSTVGADVMNAQDLDLPIGTLTMSHMAAPHDLGQRRHVARSLVEGMAYALRANLDQIRAATGAAPDSLRLGGGMSRSDVFAQLVSDVLNLPVELSTTADATALGAAVCAGVGAGVFGDLAEGAAEIAAQARTVLPEPERAEAYEKLYDGWSKLGAERAKADKIASDLILPYVLDSIGAVAAEPQQLFQPRILVTADMDEEGLARLREVGDVEYASFREMMRLLTGPTLVEALQGVHVFITEVDIVDAEVLRALPDLRVVASCRNETVNVDLKACAAFGVPVLNAPGRNAEAVADLTIAFLLMLARKLPAASAFLRQPGIEAGDIGRMGQAFTTLQGRELGRSVVGLIGLGSVGRAVARRLAGFGTHVLVHDPYVPPEQITLAGGEAASLEEILARSDFVSLHAVAGDESKHLIGADELASMKPGACLVNTARSALVDEEALVAALRDGRLAGAAVDVFPVEPPGSDHPLLQLDNVIATPHVGGNTVDVGAHQGRIIGEDLRLLLHGKPPRHVLNPEALDRFDWNRPRPEPDPSVVAELMARPAPAVSDLQRDRAAPAPPPAAAPPPTLAVPPEITERMERILSGFVERILADDALRAAAAKLDVTLHFTATDLGLSFYFSLRNGEVAGRLGDPDQPADVELKMPAEILDGMFTGESNPMQAAMTGRLAFSGDTVKAMTLQSLQDDLARLYQQAREEVGDPGDLAALASSIDAGAGAALVQPVTAGDIREEVVRVVNELYAAGYLTATGGNVSARISDKEDEVWITPGQLFKGDLRPEILVRIDLDGRSLDAGAHSPSSERMMHCAVYKVRDDAHAVIHAHAPHATTLANAGLPFLPISTEAAFFGNIPRIPFIMPGTEELALAVEKVIGDNWAVLLQNHGLLVGGRTLRRAADMVEIIDRTAEVILGCYAVGKEPPLLPDAAIRMLQSMGDLMA